MKMPAESFEHPDYLASFDPAAESDTDVIELVYRSTDDVELKERCAAQIAESTAGLIEVNFPRIEQNFLADDAPVTSAALREMIAYFAGLVDKLRTFSPQHEILPLAGEYLKKLIAKMRTRAAAESRTPHDAGLLSMNDEDYLAWLRQNPDVDK